MLGSKSVTESVTESVTGNKSVTEKCYREGYDPKLTSLMVGGGYWKVAV